jgi:hypothetical protein
LAEHRQFHCGSWPSPVLDLIEFLVPLITELGEELLFLWKALQERSEAPSRNRPAVAELERTNCTRSSVCGAEATHLAKDTALLEHGDLFHAAGEHLDASTVQEVHAVSERSLLQNDVTLCVQLDRELTDQHLNEVGVSTLKNGVLADAHLPKGALKVHGLKRDVPPWSVLGSLVVRAMRRR